MADVKAEQIAKKIILNPQLRAEYFENPEKVLAQAVPRQGFGHLSLSAPEGTQALRRELAAELEDQISSDGRLVSFREAFAEKELFLKEALQNPQRSFEAVFWMSIATFIVGLIFVAGAFVAAWQGSDTLQKAIVGGLSGSAGLVGTLGTVLAIARDTIRKMNGDNAQIRMILTDFATEITHLRAIPIGSIENAKESNAELRTLTTDMVELIEKYAEPKGEESKGQTGQEEGPGEETAGRQT